MSATFMQAPRLLFTSESGTEGHPNEICDQMPDAILDAILASDPSARVACEALVTTGYVLMSGEITTSASIDMAGIARQEIDEMDFNRALFDFDTHTCAASVMFNHESPEIAVGVNRAREAKESDDELGQTEAGDQLMMIGFACTET